MQLWLNLPLDWVGAIKNDFNNDDDLLVNFDDSTINIDRKKHTKSSRITIQFVFFQTLN
jgi:hypothetical protein